MLWNRLLSFWRRTVLTTELRKNVLITPQGPIWDRLCSAYGIAASRSHSTTAEFNDASDPEKTWRQHYAFTTYRPDREKCFEIQPVVDIVKLSCHHYLSYSQAKLLAEKYEATTSHRPAFLQVPDFYLPSRNIDHIRAEKEEVLGNTDELQLLRDLVGVSPSEIQRYVKSKEDKEMLSEQYRNIKAHYKDRLLGALTIPQLRNLLQQFHVQFTREQNNKADLLVLVDNELSKRKLMDTDTIDIDERSSGNC